MAMVDYGPWKYLCKYEIQKYYFWQIYEVDINVTFTVRKLTVNRRTIIHVEKLKFQET